MEELFSINRAAYVLGKDRATITRALRFVQPDGYQGRVDGMFAFAQPRAGRLMWIDGRGSPGDRYFERKFQFTP
jgi:hypothetical protein